MIDRLRLEYETAKSTALEYKAHITEKNDHFLNKKDEFTNTKNRLNLKKSNNLASGILKMDIYDRNIKQFVYYILFVIIWCYGFFYL